MWRNGPSLNDSITPEYLEKVARGIGIGDKITHVVEVEDHPFHRVIKRKTRLTVTGKTKHLVIAADQKGRQYTIRITDIAAEKLRKSRERRSE